jgi:hypothetical protein
MSEHKTLQDKDVLAQLESAGDALKLHATGHAAVKSAIGAEQAPAFNFNSFIVAPVVDDTADEMVSEETKKVPACV